MCALGSQLQGCQRRVAELRGSLVVLSERCEHLERLHVGAVEKIKAFAGTEKTTEQLKKQSTAKVRGLQNRHGELMRSLQELLASETWESLKTEPSAEPSGPLSSSEAMPSLPRESEEAHEVLTPVLTPVLPPAAEMSSNVKVMSLEGPAARFNSRLRA